MPALLPIILTASQIVLVADGPPKFNVKRTCRPAAVASVLPGRDASACQPDENDARDKLERQWPDTAPHSSSNAQASPRSTARRATLNY